MDPNVVTIGSAIAIFAGLFGFWWKLDGKIDSLDIKLDNKIEGVRLASETAHKDIRNELSGIRETQAAHTERFNTMGARIDCIEDKIDDLKQK